MKTSTLLVLIGALANTAAAGDAWDIFRDKQPTRTYENLDGSRTYRYDGSGRTQFESRSAQSVANERDFEAAIAAGVFVAVIECGEAVYEWWNKPKGEQSHSRSVTPSGKPSGTTPPTLTLSDGGAPLSPGSEQYEPGAGWRRRGQDAPFSATAEPQYEPGAGWRRRGEDAPFSPTAEPRLNETATLPRPNANVAANPLDRRDAPPKMKNDPQQARAETAIEELFGSQADFVRECEAEKSSAILTGRCFAARGNEIQVFGINLANRLFKLADGKVHFGALVSDSDNPFLQKDDFIIACDGIPLAPGRDLTIIVNATDNQNRSHEVRIVRNGKLATVSLETSSLKLTESQVEDRRAKDAVEAVIYRSFVKKNAIRNISWQ